MNGIENHFMIIYIGIIIVFCAIRIIPRFIFSQNGYLCTDQWFHLYLTKVYRNCGLKNSYCWPMVDVSPPYLFYPPLFHLFLTVFPKKILDRIAPYTTTFFHLFVMIAMCNFSQYLGELISPLDSGMYMLFTALIIIFYPVLFGPNSGIVFSTPRPLGVLAANCTLSSLFFISLQIRTEIFIPVFFVFFVTAALSSRFAMQAILFIGLTYAILMRDSFSLIILGLAMFLTVGFFYKIYIPIFRNHLRHIILYKKVFEKQSHYMKKKHQRIQDVISQFFKLMAAGSLKDGIRYMYNSSILRIILMNPFALLSLTAAVYITPESKEMSALYILFISGVIVCIITATPWFKFLGDAERYLEFGAMFPICFLSAWLALEHYAIFLFSLLILYSIVFSIISFKLHPEIDATCQCEALDFLKRCDDPKVLAFPTYCHPLLLSQTQARVPYLDGWQYTDNYYKDINKLKEESRFFYDIYPGPNIDTLDAQIERFGIEFLFHCKIEYASYDNGCLDQILKHYKLVFSNQGYDIYSVKNTSD